MNYRDFYKSNKSPWKKYLHLLPEGVDPKEFEMGFKDEFDDHPQAGPEGAAKIAVQHLKKNPKHYTISKKAGLEEKELLKGINLEDCACDDGLPKRPDGALDIEHDGRPIHLSKIIQVGAEFGQGPATGELSGYSAIGVKDSSQGKDQSKDGEGVHVSGDNDKEPITAGGKAVDSSIASKSVGDKVVAGGGQKQGGPNTKGSIAGTPKAGGEEEGTLSLQEAKSKLRGMVKEALKEIKFDKNSGKWVRLTEGGHKAGCKCGFCANKGKFGKKKDKEEDEGTDKKDKKKDKKEMDENTVNMKMGPSYKTVQPRMYQTAEDDWARRNQYDPEITEVYDQEEENLAKSRYNELVNAQRNLSETEMVEMKSVRERLEKIDIAKRNQGLSKGGIDPNVYESSKYDNTWEPSKYVGAKDKSRCKSCGKVLKSLGGICKCKDRKDENTVNMRMGPSGKVVSKTQARVQPDDQARTVQYQRDMTEYGAPTIEPEVDPDIDPGYPPGVDPDRAPAQPDEPQVPDPLQPDRPGIAPNPRGYHKESTKEPFEPGPGPSYEDKQEYLGGIHKDLQAQGVERVPETELTPEDEEELKKDREFNLPYKGYRGAYTGYRKLSKLASKEPIANEAGGGAVQHSSGRTANDMPQIVKNRHRGDIDEAKNGEIREGIRDIGRKIKNAVFPSWDGRCVHCGRLIPKEKQDPNWKYCSNKCLSNNKERAARHVGYY